MTRSFPALLVAYWQHPRTLRAMGFITSHHVTDDIKIT